MSWFSNLYGKITGMKTSTEQQDLMNKINDTYESIAKGVEDLNAKVINVKELKQKLKMRIWLRVEDPYIFLQLFITL
jgi:uncharacterized protein YoxC